MAESATKGGVREAGRGIARTLEFENQAVSRRAYETLER
jgi:hypothetical protein